jgi:HK97 family phage prohead protease
MGLSFGKRSQGSAVADTQQVRSGCAYPSAYEARFIKTALRSEEHTGKPPVLEGYAAVFGTLSGDLGGWRERISRGAFSRAIREGQDIRHLLNHDPSLVLGRTRAGTTVLSEDAQGLRFQTQLPATNYARDLAVSVGRGDVDGSSFGFLCRDESWTREPDPETRALINVREVRDVDLLDVSTVTYPAYPGTSTGLTERMRLMFPGTDGQVPAEIRSHIGAVLSNLPKLERIAQGGRFVTEARLKQLLGPYAGLLAVPECVPISAKERQERADWRRWAQRMIEASERPLGL